MSLNEDHGHLNWYQAIEFNGVHTKFERVHECQTEVSDKKKKKTLRNHLCRVPFCEYNPHEIK